MLQNKLPDYPEPFWRATVDLQTYPKLEQSIKVDVAIVGGGITGITAAHQLTKHNLTVALLDASNILNGTTGHTTAKITAQHGLIYDEFIQHFGEEKARLYFEAQQEAKNIIFKNIHDYQIKCDFKTEDAYIYTNSDDYIKKLETEIEAYEKLKIPGQFLNQIPLDIPIKSALMMPNQAQFHPLKYLNVLVEESIKNGLTVYEQTNAVDVEYNKHPAVITEEGYRVTCRYVIIATQFPFYDGQGFYPTRMYADRSYVLGMVTDKKYPGGMYINAEKPTRSVRSTPYQGNDLWLIIGENHKTGQGKETEEHYQALQDYAKNAFQLTEIAYRWSAQDLTTLDKLPYIGPITKAQQSVFVATGYRKWGMTNGTIAAEIISDKILEQENRYADIFTPSRFSFDPAIKKFTSINLDVAKHLIKGKFENTKDLSVIENMPNDEAIITRINGNRAGVYKDKDGKLNIVDTTCTHLRCELEWNSGDRTWDCPCHGSRFSYTGEVITGPAKRPLNKIE